jgi:hypothetical protein
MTNIEQIEAQSENTEVKNEAELFEIPTRHDVRAVVANFGHEAERPWCGERTPSPYVCLNDDDQIELVDCYDFDPDKDVVDFIDDVYNGKVDDLLRTYIEDWKLDEKEPLVRTSGTKKVDDAWIEWEKDHRLWDWE